MENLTHSLVGATLAELALPAAATQRQRRLFFTVGVVAANLPDADLVYTRILPAPLGYLLHHRGHTHTLVGLLGQLMLVGVVLLFPRIQTTVREAPRRFWALAAMALVSHVMLDSWNSYGIHPLWPIDNSWYYGDAISIFEPWLWIFLGLAAAMNTRSAKGRVIVFALPFALIGLTLLVGAVDRGMGVVLLAAALAYGLVLRPLSHRRRSIIALALTTVFVVCSFGLSRSAYARAVSSLGVDAPRVLDIVLTPRPARPLCWTALTVETAASEEVFLLRRGSVSVGPPWLACSQAGEVLWEERSEHSLTALRETAARDCWVRGWLQFARAPAFADGLLMDARFGMGARGSFTALLPSKVPRACPAPLTNWVMPRGDLLGR